MVRPNEKKLYELGLTRGRGWKVPIIALFTKYDQFKCNIKMKLEDEHDHPEMHIDAVVKRAFEQHYLACLTGPPPFICLESEDFIMDKHIFYSILSYRDAQEWPTVY